MVLDFCQQSFFDNFETNKYLLKSAHKTCLSFPAKQWTHKGEYPRSRKGAKVSPGTYSSRVAQILPKCTESLESRNIS